MTIAPNQFQGKTYGRTRAASHAGGIWGCRTPIAGTDQFQPARGGRSIRAHYRLRPGFFSIARRPSGLSDRRRVGGFNLPAIRLVATQFVRAQLSGALAFDLRQHLTRQSTDAAECHSISTSALGHEQTETRARGVEIVRDPIGETRND